MLQTIVSALDNGFLYVFIATIISFIMAIISGRPDTSTYSITLLTITGVLFVGTGLSMITLGIVSVQTYTVSSIVLILVGLLGYIGFGMFFICLARTHKKQRIRLEDNA